MTKHFTNTNNPIDFPKQSMIDRLWGEALDKAVPDTYSTLTWTQVEKIKTVFAELIVKECIQLADQYGSGGAGSEFDVGYTSCANTLSDEFKKRFGVEE